jgi:EAL domain-containing protein (putative c-di-GMP-specific phosphodiesterase class I)
MGEIDRLLPMFHTIKALGVSISLDDFGTGFFFIVFATLPYRQPEN